MPRVSIGMPVYNGEEFLERALDSLLAQSFSDFELIISDNASQDKTQEICLRYAARDPRVKYYRNETNIGAAENFNRVFALSSGEYFKWAGHDDSWTPDYLERCVSSVTRQSYSNLEIFLVDDGSPDKCPEMCDAFARADSRITVIHQENAGQGVARNAALDLCAGAYIMFVDSDDWIDPGMVQFLVEVAQEDGADLVQCGLRAVGAIRSRRIAHCERSLRFDNVSLMREYLVAESISRGPVAKLYRHYLFKHTRFPAVRAREDAYVMHEILGQVQRATLIPQALYIQVIRPGSTERSGFNDAMLISVETSRRLVEYVGSRYPTLLTHARWRRARTLAQLMLEIRSTFSYRKYRRTYADLRDQLRAEIAGLELADQEYDMTLIENAADDRLPFRYKCAILGTKIVLARWVSKLRGTAARTA